MKKELQLADTWELLHGNKVTYTFTRGSSASRLYRFYTLQKYKNETYKIRVEKTDFSDHDGLILSIQTNTRLPTYGRGSWKINNIVSATGQGYPK